MDEKFRHERVTQDLKVKSCLKSYSKQFNIFLCKIHFSELTIKHPWWSHIKRKSENPQHTALF